MRNIPIRRLWATVALLFMVASASAAPFPYAGIVVFGTSLSDPGNAFVLRDGINTPPEYLFGELLVPSAAYARGGHHLSNGAPWIVQFARPLGLAASVQPAFRDSSPKATNYAVDRARARDDGININLSDQVGRFLQDVNGLASSDRLYVVEFGSNDVFDALETYVAGGDGGPVLQAALAAIATRLGQLYAAGARKFLIANVPDIALTPAVHMAEAMFPGMGLSQLASTLAQNFNSGLASVVAQLPSDADVAWLDIYGKLNEIVADPLDYGLSNVTDPCVMPGEAPFACRNPDEYIFWDGIHPTKAVHAIFAEEAERSLLP
jgi:phospholipase/lecithinase/hemolysin